jgi:hypothetical protein
LRDRIGLISDAQFAAMMMVSEYTTQQWRVAGTGPTYVRLGRAVFYRLNDIELWVGSNTHQSTETSALTRAKLEVADAVGLHLASAAPPLPAPEEKPLRGVTVGWGS